MKNAKDYERNDGPGRTTITSLAYWLTPEGLSNPIIAKLLRNSIQSATDDEFKEAFDGASKDDARTYLESYELCAMPYWGAEELAKAIHDADNGRDEKLTFRAVTLAQKAGEIQDYFTPKQGIEWAMDRGYLFGSHARFVGAAIGSYGHPHNPLSDGPHSKQAAPATDTATPAAVDAVGALGGMELLSENKPKRNTATGPVFSMKKAAMIEQHKHEWPTIEGDMRDAATNGLSTAKAGVRDWDKTAALAWAQAKGKLKSASKPADALTQAMHGLSNLPTTRHILKG